jgi:HSP20 family protein
MAKPTNGKEQPREQSSQRPNRAMMPGARGGFMSRSSAWPLTRLRTEFDRLFDDFFRGWGVPGIPEESQMGWGFDVEDQPDKVIVRAEAPGFEPNEFDLQVQDNQLVLCACASDEKKEEGGRQWRRQELYRSIPLPSGIDAERVDAQYKNGILTVTMPKTEQSKSRKIEVKT